MDDIREELIFRVISHPRATRDAVAGTYAILLLEMRDRRAEYDWPKINAAILEKWSPSGLEYIKRSAWKQAHLGTVEIVTRAPFWKECSPLSLLKKSGQGPRSASRAVRDL